MSLGAASTGSGGLGQSRMGSAPQWGMGGLSQNSSGGWRGNQMPLQSGGFGGGQQMAGGFGSGGLAGMGGGQAGGFGSGGQLGGGFGVNGGFGRPNFGMGMSGFGMGGGLGGGMGGLPQLFSGMMPQQAQQGGMMAQQSPIASTWGQLATPTNQNPNTRLNAGGKLGMFY